jgi:hypothetical protein
MLLHHLMKRSGISHVNMRGNHLLVRIAGLTHVKLHGNNRLVTIVCEGVLCNICLSLERVFSL